MFKFYFKKNFCDGWDNFFFIAISNFITIALAAGSYFAVTFSASINPYVPNLVFIACCAILMMSIFAFGSNAAKLADFGTPTFANYFSTLKYVWKTGLLFGALIGISLLVIRVSILYYLTMFLKDGSKYGLILTAVLCWFVIVCVLALQWFIPLYFLQDDNSFVKCLKKSFIIFFDNAGFTIKVFFVNAVLFIITCMTIGLFPGLNGILISCTNALRLRLYKYDWLEEHPEFLDDRDKRSEVPWDELLAEDKESLGERKFGSFIFPWK